MGLPVVLFTKAADGCLRPAVFRSTTMKPTHLFAFALLCLIVLPVALFLRASAQTSTTSLPEPTPATEYRLSGPYTHKNLTVFLVHGKDSTNKTFLTLQEALAQKKVRVYETKDVNELAIRNFSNQDVYVQSGDIVRGGEQDRMISVDFIVPPRSGRMPIAAFCVESDRWNRRGGEAAGTFDSSVNSAPMVALKLAVKSKDVSPADAQSAVWKNVSEVQEKLTENTLVEVRSVESRSSLELSLENSAVRATTASYTRALTRILRNKHDVIGYVFAINGKVNSADIYASRALFAKLWPKLIKASAVEALAELQADLELKPVSDEMVRTFLGESEQPTAAMKHITARVKLVSREDDKTAFFETQDRSEKDNWIHRSYIRKQ